MNDSPSTILMALADVLRPLEQKIAAIESRFAVVEQMAVLHKRKLAMIPGDQFDQKQAADYLRVSRTTLRKLRDSGELPYYWYGGRITYKRSDLDALIEKYRVDGRRKLRAVS